MSGRFSSKRNRHYVIVPILEKFFSKVKKTESCWLWLGSKNNKGYGLLAVSKIGRKSDVQLAHRVSWWIHNDHIYDGLQVLHKCDNPICVNPDHLFLGTQSDNIRDCVTKNRHWAPWKLSKEQLLVIKQLMVTGLTDNEIAGRFGVSRRAINHHRRSI